MQPAEPDPVKWMIAALFSSPDRLRRALDRCIDHFGPIDFQSERYPFDATDYYTGEMGTPIYRQFISFSQLANPGRLASAKLETNAIETELAVAGRRWVNLDIGYLDYHKVVLASMKFNGHKIYLDKGVYADPILSYRKGKFHPAERTFPDFKDPERYSSILLAIRDLYKGQRQRGESGMRPASL